MVEAFQRSHDFITEARAAGGQIVVHCMAGISRSSSIVIAHLMLGERWSLQQTLSLVRQRRAVYPNDGFMMQLLLLEDYLRSTGEAEDRVGDCTAGLVELLVTPSLPYLNRPFFYFPYLGHALDATHAATSVPTRHWCHQLNKVVRAGTRPRVAEIAVLPDAQPFFVHTGVARTSQWLHFSRRHSQAAPNATRVNECRSWGYKQLVACPRF